MADRSPDHEWHTALGRLREVPGEPVRMGLRAWWQPGWTVGATSRPNVPDYVLIALYDISTDGPPAVVAEVRATEALTPFHRRRHVEVYGAPLPGAPFLVRLPSGEELTPLRPPWGPSGSEPRFSD